MPHYNTTKESGAKLQGYNEQVASQETMIANFFQFNSGEIFTPWEVQSLVFRTKTPITSIRRSISDLTKAGILTKTEHMKETGIYGRRSYAWMLNVKYFESLQVMNAILGPDEPGDSQNEAQPNKAATNAIEGINPVNGANPQGVLFNVPAVGNRCRNCNRILSDPKSIERGIGPVCFKCEEDKS